MKIINDHPPNYAEICKAFDIKDKPGVIFTYGDTVYNPSGEPLPHHIEVHEQTHITQQKIMGAKKWWEQYLVDPQFRLSQELEAYRNQWKIARKKRNWREIESILAHISKDLSGEMYGNLMTVSEARGLITK